MVTLEVIKADPLTRSSDWQRPNQDQPIEERANAHGITDLGLVTGSGVLFDGRGYIITCSHVIESSVAVHVRLSDNRRLSAVRLFSDPVSDIAVIQIASKEPLPVATLGNSDDLEIGDWVVSVGNPYELGLSISAGIVSALDRHLPSAPRTHLLQTDAATNPGNSGGALINLKGQVVGISEGGYGVTEGFQGIGFAIPINAAMKIANRLIQEGSVEHIQLGFDTQPLDKRTAAYLGLVQEGGLIICDIAPDSPAKHAGVLLGDVIDQIAGHKIRTACDLVTAIEIASPKEPLMLKVIRAGKTIELKYTPKAIEIEQSVSEKGDAQFDGFVDTKFGLVLKEMDKDERSLRGRDGSLSGLVVTRTLPGSLSAQEGIMPGNMILRIGNRDIDELQAYQAAIKNVSTDHGILVLVTSHGYQRFVLMQKSKP
jgi:serine protease Do